jgi:uncharacterized protein YciI
MARQHVFFRLIPPRPTFAQDMSEGERALMGEHAAYLHGYFELGTILAYGPVFDPAGTFGIALFDVEDIAEAQRIADADPTIRAGLNTYSLAPMYVTGSRSPVS